MAGSRSNRTRSDRTGKAALGAIRASASGCRDDFGVESTMMAASRRLAVWVGVLSVAWACAGSGMAPWEGAARAFQEAVEVGEPPADAELAIHPGDTGFMLICAALVMLMTPGLGLFYAGMTRQKNVLATFKKSFVALGVVSVQWFAVGYSLSFAPSSGEWGLIGGLDWAFLNGVGLEPNATYCPTFPMQLHMIYQLMFAIITPALISGAFVERVKFTTYVVFVLLWTTLVYDPLAHWVWGGGWMNRVFASYDFAGGVVVHISSGFAALAAALIAGRRAGYGEEEMLPHNLTMTALGTALLWFGWFGFNAGSALGATSTAVAAFVNTHLATAAAVVCWLMIEQAHHRRTTLLGACTAAVAGLVAITPAAGFVSPLGAVLIGILVCPFCYAAILVKNRIGYDDSLDAFGVHGVGGFFGAVVTGLLVIPSLALDGGPGLFYGGGATVAVNQLMSALIAAGYSFGVTYALLKILDKTMGLRVSEEEENLGLDAAVLRERGYVMEVGEFIMTSSNRTRKDSASASGAGGANGKGESAAAEAPAPPATAGGPELGLSAGGA